MDQNKEVDQQDSLMNKDCIKLVSFEGDRREWQIYLSFDGVSNFEKRFYRMLVATYTTDIIGGITASAHEIISSFRLMSNVMLARRYLVTWINLRK